MNKFKRFAAIAAVSMLGIQLMGAGTAFAIGGGGDGTCDFGSNDLEITLGEADAVDLWIEEDRLYCDTLNNGGSFNSGGGGGTAGDDYLPLSVVESITVEMDDDDSAGELWIGLEDEGTTDAAEWPEFDTFDIDVTTRVHLDGTGVDDEGANRLQVVVGASTLEFGGTEAAFSAGSVDFMGGEGKDSLDASKATIRIFADGGDGDDVLKGGSGKDDLAGGDDVDVLYGNGGNDDLECGGEGTAKSYEQGWGGADADYILDCNVVAPGSGDDDIYNGGTYEPYDDEDDEDLNDAADLLVLVSYADLTKGIEWDEGTTGGEAGDDIFDSAPRTLVGSAGDDVIFDVLSVSVSGGAGDDLVKVGFDAAGGAGNDLVAEYGSGTDNVLTGNAGDDVLRGKAGDDSLFGGPGKDQAWGASGSDTCRAEVTNRCDYGKI